MFLQCSFLTSFRHALFHHVKEKPKKAKLSILAVKQKLKKAAQYLLATN